ncbi:MAG: YcbK family protein [Pseudomonadota bacterium]
MTPINWEDYPDFHRYEFECSETGECDMDPDFMRKLQILRTRYGKPIIPNSGYRSPNHSLERGKDRPGAHAQGCAVDVPVSNPDAHHIVRLAMELGFNGIGVSQKSGGPRYIHLDTWSFRRAIWSY